VIVKSLAEAIYDVLRLRLALDDPRITYAELARQLRDLGPELEFLYHRSRELYAALVEVGKACRRLHLPPLPALVVRADSRRPGDAYYSGRLRSRSRDERIAAWQRDLDAVKRASYPSHPERS
jgi:hypothetical protein